MSALKEFLAEYYNLLIVLAGVSLLGAAAGVIGCFAVLRRRSLTGDALAHGALPGLCIAFILVGERSLPKLLLGALGSGLAGIAVIAALRRWTRIKEDAAIGTVLSVFFGIGIVLLTIIQRLPGGSTAGLDSFILGKTAGMVREDVELIAGLALGTLLLVLLLYKEFKLVSFDQEFARVQGWPGFFLDFLLMLLVVLAVVIGLPAVGVLMMAALLVIPAAAARFWTDSLGLMLVLSAGIGLVSGVAGTVVSALFAKIPTGPSIILAAAIIFLYSLLGAPRRGLLARWEERRRHQWVMQRRQFLAVLYELVEPSLPLQAALPISRFAGLKGWTRRQLQRQVRAAERANDCLREGDTLVLSPGGLGKAAAAARDQRLWKLFLREHPEQAAPLLTMDLPPLEGFLPAAQVADLVAKLRAQGRWPAIPEPGAEGRP